MTAPRYQRNTEVLSTVVEDEVVLLSPELRFLSLNDSAARIWELLAEPVTAEEVARALAEEFDVDPQTARAAVERTVAALVSTDSVRVAPSSLNDG